MSIQTSRLDSVDGGFAAVDRHVARLLRRLAEERGEDAEVLEMSAALVSRERGRGHACVPLDALAGRPITLGERQLTVPHVGAWRAALEASSLVAALPQATTTPRPLVLDSEGRLYLWRYWYAEQRLASRLRRLAEHEDRRRIDSSSELDRCAELFTRLFPAAASSRDIDWQAAAAATALISPLTLVSGGPGTGKTTTALRLLALVLGTRPETEPSVRVALAAPTGKAAVRLEEAISAQLDSLDEDLCQRLGALPRHASTLHRLLGYSYRRDRFHHHARRPLTCDLLVIDEASMVDLLMMDATLDALPPGARLVLLGDRDQLSSVDTGFVFGDLCRAAGLGSGFGEGEGAGADAGAGEASLPPRLAETYSRLVGRAVPARHQEVPAPPLEGRGVELRTSYRFRDRPGIGALARALRDGAGDAALAVLDDPDFPEVRRHDPSAEAARMLEPIVPALDAYLASDSPATALERLDAFRILCATRGGRWGIRRLNRLVESRLAQLGRFDGSLFYPGRPILIEANDYQVQLFNGDLGVCWPQQDENDESHVWTFFRSASGLRRVALAKLPPHTTAWAMTVHKSQGSEVDHVILVLGEDDPGAFTSRELVYTGVTRARREVDLVTSPQLLRDAVSRSSRRVTGLTDALSAPRSADG